MIIRILLVGQLILVPYTPMVLVVEVVSHLKNVEDLHMSVQLDTPQVVLMVDQLIKMVYMFLTGASMKNLYPSMNSLEVSSIKSAMTWTMIWRSDSYSLMMSHQNMVQHILIQVSPFAVETKKSSLLLQGIVS